MNVNCMVLSYNHPDLTGRCLESALAFFPKDKLLLVHNGSEKKNIKLLQSAFPEVEHLIIDTNIGYSGGANAGLTKAFETAELVLFLTNDCELLSYSPLKISGPAAQWAPHILKRKTEQTNSLGGFLWPARGLLGHFRSREEWEQFQGLRYIPGTAFFLQREIWTSGLRFHESLGTYWEDVLFSRELEKNGFALKLCPDIKLRHGIGKTCHKNSYYTSYLYQRNRRWVSLLFTHDLAEKFTFWLTYLRDLSKLLFRSLIKADFSKCKLILAALFEKSKV